MSNLLNRIIVLDETVVEERYNHCLSCEHFLKTVKVCKLCHCFMPAKTKLTLAECPDDPPRWGKANPDQTRLVDNPEE